MPISTVSQIIKQFVDYFILISCSTLIFQSNNLLFTINYRQLIKKVTVQSCYDFKNVKESQILLFFTLFWLEYSNNFENSTIYWALEGYTMVLYLEQKPIRFRCLNTSAKHGRVKKGIVYEYQNTPCFSVLKQRKLIGFWSMVRHSKAF